MSVTIIFHCNGLIIKSLSFNFATIVIFLRRNNCTLICKIIVRIQTRISDVYVYMPRSPYNIKRIDIYMMNLAMI
jgi:hypothetical protein